jgi:sugar lactone lactonase YvrE
MSALLRVVVGVLACLSLWSLEAAAWDRGKVEKFATLPAGYANPEGLTVGPHGDVFVTTFAATGTGATKPGQLFVFDGDSGRLKRQVSVAGSSNLLLGLAFHPDTHELLVIDFGHAQVLRVNSHTGASSVFMTVTGGAGLNGLTFDRRGNVYVSDSFQGIIWRTGPGGGAGTIWVQDDLLKPNGGTPGFGANGVEFNSDESALFVANTAMDQIIRIPFNAGAHGTPAVFVNSANGADGIAIDEDDNIWIAANQADEIVVIDKTGRVIAKLGDFGGLDESDAPIGLLFPASPAISGGYLYVTNLSLDIRVVGAPQAVDSQWAAEVRSHTVARLRASIPRVPR